MSQPTAVVKVLCKPEKLEETANLIAWTVGHRVEIADTVSAAETRWLFVFTDLAYYDDDDTILERLGLDIIGKIGGVLSWEVVPSDQQAAAPDATEQPSDPPSQALSLEERLTFSLGDLPVPVSIMRRKSGKYAWKWQEVTGQADTFVDALTAVLTLAMRSYRAVLGEIDVADRSQVANSEAALERELINTLVGLPSPVVIMESSGGTYAWKWGETAGQAETFADAVTSGLTLAMTAYAEARSRLIES